jgi:hypothetical protein
MNKEMIELIFNKIKGNVWITLSMYPETMPLEGNASCIDEETDAANNEWIRSEIESGNDWAWCHVRVTATLGAFSGSDSIGGCSCRSEDDFRNTSGYFADMVAEATLACAHEIAESIDALRRLELIP